MFCPVVVAPMHRSDRTRPSELESYADIYIRSGGSLLYQHVLEQLH